MKYIKYNLIFAMAFMWAAVGILAVPTVSAAPNDLIVDFEATPLFNEANFLPGSEVSRWAKVKNNTPDAKLIIVEAINESDPDGLASVFEIGIYESGIQRYGTTTLAAFFAAGEVSLSDLAGGGTQTQYDFLVRFVPGAGNTYQEKSVGFDILIGFEGAESGGGDGTFTTDPPNGGGGGGNGGGGGGGGVGGGPLSGLVIQNEAAVTVTNTTATVVWNTSFESTSRVVYGTVPGVFDFSLPPNYGYLFSTLEFDTPANPNGVTFHSITITGLTPSTSYYFRTISHASPDTISKEASFTTLGIPPGGGSGLPPSGSNVFAHSENALSSQTLVAGGGTGQTQDGIMDSVLDNMPGANSAEASPLDEVSQNTGNDNSNLLAAALFGIGANIWWLLLILLILFIIYLIYRRYKSDK